MIKRQKCSLCVRWTSCLMEGLWSLLAGTGRQSQALAGYRVCALVHRLGPPSPLRGKVGGLPTLTGGAQELA